MNDRIILELSKLAEKEKFHHQFKFKAYLKAIQSLKNFPDPISTIQQVANLPGIGKGIQEKIQEILETGQLTLSPPPLDPKQELLQQLLQIYGVGEKKAKELIDSHKIQSLLELRDRTELLNEKQQIGLKYYDHLLERIPHQEMLVHEKFIRGAWSGDIYGQDLVFDFEIVGSFRRRAKTSGDIDILVTFDSSQNLLPRLIFILRRQKYILETLAEGSKKFMGICKLPYLTPRRIDIIWTAPEEYPFALFYFTGSDQYNRRVREVAHRQGWKLNERGIIPMTVETRELTLPDFRTERDITDFLGLPFVPPENRMS